MTKEELEKYARENRKRLEAQEVKLGDVVEVLVGQFAGEIGVIVGIIACGNDYADPYYEIDMSRKVPDKYKCRKSSLMPNVVGGFNACEFITAGIKIGDRVNELNEKGTLRFIRGNNLHIQLDNGEWLVSSLAPFPEQPMYNVGDTVKVNNSRYNKVFGNFGVVKSVEEIGGDFYYTLENDTTFRECYLEPYYSAEDVRRMEEEQNKRTAEYLREHSGKDTNNPVKDIADVVEEYRKGFAKIASELASNDWQHYRAELASKIAVAYAEKGRYKPSEIGEFAVMVTNDVVDHLKKQSE